MGHIGTAASARPRGTAAGARQAGRPGVLPIFLVGAAIPCGMWAVMWFLDNVVDPGCGDLLFGCLGTLPAMLVLGVIEVVGGGIVAGALPSRAPAWQRLVGLSAGLALSLALVAVVKSRLQEPFEWTYLHDPGGLAALALSHWAGLLPYVGAPALVACGVVTLLRWVHAHWDPGRAAAIAPAAATDPADGASVAPGRVWDGTRWVDSAGATDGRSGRGR